MIPKPNQGSHDGVLQRFGVFYHLFCNFSRDPFTYAINLMIISQTISHLNPRTLVIFLCLRIGSVPTERISKVFSHSVSGHLFKEVGEELQVNKMTPKMQEVLELLVTDELLVTGVWPAKTYTY